MKKVCIVLMVMVANIVEGNAQYFVEGTAAMGYNGGKYSFMGYPGDGNTYKGYSVSPLLGYKLNDKHAVGAKVTFVGRTELLVHYDDLGNKVEVESKYPGWGFSVFNRYKLWGTEKLSLLLESSFSFSRTDNTYNSESGEVISMVGVNVLPLLTYDLNKKFTLVAKCNFLVFDLYQQTRKSTTSDLNSKRLYCNIGVTSDSFISVSGLQLGIIYNIKNF